jgi:hypothetical protein
LLFGVCFRGDSHAGDGMLTRENTVFASCKTKLYRAAHLACIFASAHNGPKGADIKIVFTHPLFGRFGFVRTLFLGFYEFLLMGFVNQVIEDGLFLDENLHLGVLPLRHLDEIPNFTFQANIGHKAIAGLGINTRKVSRVGVAVGVAVFYIEQQYKLITVLDGVTHASSPCASVSFFVKKSCR